MSIIRDHIFHKLKQEESFNPFSDNFDSKEIQKEFDELQNKKEVNLLHLLKTCNGLFEEIKLNIFKLFDEINLKPNDLREFLFIAVNKYFLDLYPAILKGTNSGVVIDLGKTMFTKFTNEHEQELNAQFAIEIGADILSELINFSYQWKPIKKEFSSLFKSDSEELGKHFHMLWIHINILRNIKYSAYHIVVFENGIVNIPNLSEIKIENGQKSIQLLKSVGEIRATNQTQEFFFTFSKYYNNVLKNKIGVNDFKIDNNILSPIRGKSASLNKIKAISSLYIFYPHFTDEKLDYFDGLCLDELIDVVVLIEECFETLIRVNVEKFIDRPLNEVPIKFNESELVQFLSESTGHHINTITKIISSLIADSSQPYFWREPFIKVDNFLYFSIAASVSPNYCLYFDKWTTLCGFTLDLKEKNFTSYILKELSEIKDIPYEFKILELETLNLNHESFINNILIETASLLVLLEVKVFDFPIESPEVDTAMIRLGNATFDIEEKAKQIINNFDVKKELVKIIITNYTTFSGLQINKLPIADLILFKNYISVGKFRRAAVTFHDDKPVVNDGGIISYYRNEEEFNGNLKSFFADPLPVRHILQKLYFKELQITPDIVKPKFFTETIEHLTDKELMDSSLESLSDLLNYEYFREPDEKVIKDLLDQSIIYSLTEIFRKLSYSSYESYEDRLTLYQKISKTKLNGFSHLSFFILKAIEKLNGKKIKEIKYFDTVEYEPEEVFKLIKEKIGRFSKNMRLSDFKIDDKTFNEVEEKKIISFSIDALNGLTSNSFSNDVLDTIFLPLALLQGLSTKYDVEFEFYSACGNIVDGLNHIHKYQTARDFCEEILALSIKNEKHSYGWNILFRCYTYQKSSFDASINGCIFLSSIILLPEIPYSLAVDSLYEVLKFFRNFGYTEYAKYTYENLQLIDLNKYDKQKITLTYFNSFFQGVLQKDIKNLDQVIDYVEKNINDIISFGEHGVVPWLAFFYNIERLKMLNQISYSGNIKLYIDKFENSITKESVEKIRIKILGNKENQKELFISALMNTYETRSVTDFVHETQHLSLIASNLLQTAIINEDFDNILLAGLIINDQSFTFKNVNIEPFSVSSVSKPENEKLKLQLNNYKFYLLSKINLKPKQLLIWIFEDIGKVYAVFINSSKDLKLFTLEKWDYRQMLDWLKGIKKFYFNSKKDSFNNPTKEYHYEFHVQKDDYDFLKDALSFATLTIPKEVDELFIYNSIELASFPHNLIQNTSDFISSSIPICNVISIERFVENSNQIYLNNEYSISAWIPTEDQEPLISWGFGLLQSTLERINAKIFTSTYPEEIINTDLNIFLAHGVTDGSGFKAVYTNHEDKKGIVFPHNVFGTGKIAILFVCNSGSSHDALFSNSVVSFSGELLKSGYESVVAPFWPFDVTMSKIWLVEFLDSFNQGFSINESVWLANKKLSKYDPETSNIYIAPAGCMAMHLYGNPNIYVKADE